jgi:hypothetical protein
LNLSRPLVPSRAFAPVTQRFNLLQRLLYPSNRTLYSICYRATERPANGKREFKQGKKEKKSGKSSRIIKSGKSGGKRICVIRTRKCFKEILESRVL